MRVPAHRLVAAAVAIGVAFTAGIFTGSSSSSGRPSSPSSSPPSAEVRNATSSGPTPPFTSPVTPPVAPPAVPSGPGQATLAPADPSRSSGTPSPAAPAPALKRPPGTSQTADVDDVLRQGGTRPDDIAEQLTVYLDGGVGCSGGDAVPGPAVVTPEYVRIPSLMAICLIGLDQGRALTYTVTDPAGAARTRTLPPGWDVMFDLTHLLPAGTLPGRHRVTVVQDGTRLTTAFQARRSTKATILVQPKLSVAGSTVDVYLGGFRPGEDVPLHLYRGDVVVDYRATVTVRADRNGEAHLVLRTSRDTPPGIYLIVNPAVVDTLAGPGMIPSGLDFQIDPPPVS